MCVLPPFISQRFSHSKAILKDHVVHYYPVFCKYIVSVSMNRSHRYAQLFSDLLICVSLFNKIKYVDFCW